MGLWIIAIAGITMAYGLLFLWGMHHLANRISRLEIDVAQLRFVAWVGVGKQEPHDSAGQPPENR